MWYVFLLSFLAIALFYAILGSFTKVLYRNKPVTSMSIIEIQILRGEASFSSRLMMFFKNFSMSVFFPQAYIGAALITFVYWLSL
jgi:hypothetical protein